MTVDDLMLPSDPDGELATELVQARMLCAQASIAFLYPVLACLALGLLLRDVAPKLPLLGWTAAMVLQTAGRYILLRPTRPPPREYLTRWFHRFAASVLLSGALWGAAPVLLVPPLPHQPVEFALYNCLTLLVVCGLAAGALASYAVSRFVLFLFCAPALVPPAVYLISMGDRYNSALGGFVLLYFAFITSSCLRLHVQMMRFVDLVRETHRLRRKLECLDTRISGHG